MNGVSFSLAVPASGWSSDGSHGIGKGITDETYKGGLILWNGATDGIFTVPCDEKRATPVVSSAANLAEAIAKVPGTTATGPSDVTVGGFPAKLVVVKIPDVAACKANDFFLWWSLKQTGRYATELGSTIKVWIVDVNGTLLQMDGEFLKGSGPEVEKEMQQIVDSIQFK